MTTIPGHNIVIQQSGALHEATQHARPVQPDPEKFAAEQALKEQEARTTVQETEESDEIQADKEKRNSTEQHRKKKSKKKKPDEDSQPEEDPEAPGRLLDTIA